MKTLFLSIIALVVLTATGGVTTHASSADGQIKKTTDITEPSDSVNHFTAIEDERGNRNLIKTIGVFKISGNGVWFELGAPISNKNYKTIIPENNTLFDFE
ncbi:MAG TPA: hypothetical protein VLB01_00485 [Thermodesulfobacteriota bacterium]|nr:hypothetical protein [Thermodesulfobacteriota bacterium]